MFFFGYAYSTENEDALPAIEIGRSAGECVAPSKETVLSGDYPLSRPLFIYVKKTALSRDEVREFVRFYLERTPELISEVGYIPVPEEDYKTGLAALDASRPGAVPSVPRRQPGADEDAHDDSAARPP